MARLFLRTLPRRVLQVVGAMLLLSVVAFFALTRTEVGRTALKKQIEAQFDERFAGSLEIGRLTGDLIGTVYARDVRLLDAEGQPFVRVDSVRATPRWRSLLGRQVAFGEIELIGPRAYLVRSARGTWNAARAFRRTATRDTSGRGDPFALRFADVVVRDGTIRTANRGTPPRLVRSGWLFDYADARLADVDARFSFERTAGDGLVVDLNRFGGRLVGAGLPVEVENARVSLGDGSLAVRPLRIRLGQTRLRGAVSLERESRSRPPAVRVSLDESRLAHDELRRLVPRWPLHGTTTLALEARGPLDDLTVDRVRVERGASMLRAEGAVRGWPERLAFDLRFAENRLTAADLRAVLPGLPPAQTARLARLGTARFSLEAQGRLASLGDDARRRLSASARFDAQTDAGALSGIARVRRGGGEQPLSYSAEVRADDFAAGRLGAEAGLPSRLTGTLALEGKGTSARTLTGQVEARLEASTLAGRRLDGLEVDLRTASEGRLEGTATLRQRGGVLRAEGTVNRGGPLPAYDLSFRADGFDLGALLGSDGGGGFRTALTGTARLDGRGTSLGTLAGRLDLALDSSTVTRGDSTRALVPLTSTLRLRPPGEAGPGAPRLTLRGDVADLTVTGETNLRALRAVGRLWGRAYADALVAVYRKPYRSGEAPSAQQAARAALPSAAAREAVRNALAEARLGKALTLDADLTLKQPAALRALMPGLPEQRDTVRLTLGLEAGAGTLSTRGAVRTQRLHAGRLRADDVSGTFRARASLDAPLVQTLDASFDASADTLLIGGTRLQTPALAADFRDGAGDVQLFTRAAGGSGRLQFEAGLRPLADRNRLTVRTLRLHAGAQRWQNTEPARVDLYADAIAVPALTLTSRNGAESGSAQRLTLRGVLSGAPADTLYADAQDVRLGALARLAGLRRPLGGRLDAQVAWTGAASDPELTGRLDAARLAFDDHRLGRLTVRSRYVPGSPRLAFEMRLRPGPSWPAEDDTEDRVEAGRPSERAPAVQFEENRLSASGTVVLPGFGDGETDDGALDLSLDVDRADLFFFNYIFNDKIAGATGALSGGGRIGGSFRDPRFQTTFQIADASFRVPRFGLRYDAQGRVAVDEEGIKIDGARLYDAGGGSAQIDGALLFNDYQFFSFDLRAALDELRVIDVEESPDLPFFGQIAGSGALRLRGPLSDASLTSPGGVRTTPESQLVIPIEESDASGGGESGFLIFADSTGRLPDLDAVTRRENILADRPQGERSFIDGLDLDLGITAPAGSTVRLVFDPLLGDEIAAVGGGEIQLLREEGAFSLFGTFDVTGGSYLFTAGQVFQRRFQIEGGTLRWDGSAANAALDLTATYRTRASRAGLPGAGREANGRIPIVVRLGIDGRVQQPAVDLSLAVDQSDRGFNDYSTAGLETVLNRSDRGSEYATSVLLTNTFLLTTDLAGAEGGSQGFSETGNRLAFNSVSQLVSSQLNRYLSEALPGLDVNLGVQGEDPQDLDVIYGVALRLLDERLLIRGEGVFDSTEGQNQPQGFQGEFVVEVRLTPRVSAEVFYRREGSLLSERALTSTAGAGLSYQTEFPTWRKLWHRLFGWLGAGPPEERRPPPENTPVAAGE